MITHLISIMPFMVCIFWLATLVADYRHWQYRANIWLAVFMAVTAVLYASHFIFFNHVLSIIPLSDCIYTFANLAVYPLFYFYVNHLSSHKPISRPRMAALLLPACICSVTVAVLYSLMSPEQTHDFISHFLYHNELKSSSPIIEYQIITHIVARVCFAGLVIFSLLMSIRAIMSLNRIIQSNYTNLDGKETSPYVWLLILMATASIVGFIANALGKHLFADNNLVLLIPAIIFSSILYTIGFLGFKMRFSIKDIINDDIIITSETDDNTSIDKIREQIQDIMRQEKLFLQPNLKINDIAQLIGTNRHYIYQAINGQMGASFNDFINKQRIDYALQLMKDKPNLTINEVALQSGFTSQASFYRNFKKFVGTSPRTFLTPQ